MNNRLRNSYGLALSVLVLGLIGITVWLAIQNQFDLALLDYLIPVGTAALLSGLIITYRPGNLAGWLIFLFTLIFSLSEFSRQYAIYGVVTNPGALPFAGIVAAGAYIGWVPGLICLTVFLPLVFPTGHLISRRWRVVTWLALAVIAGHTLFSLSVIGDIETPGVPNPFANQAFQDWLLNSPFLMIVYIIWLLITVLAAFSLVVRYRQAGIVIRKQIKWGVFAFILLAIYTLADVMINIDLPIFLFSVVLQLVWVILTISILWNHLFDIDLIIRRTLVYTVLTSILVLIYFAVVSVLQNLFLAASGQQSTIAIVLSTLAIAALFTPLRRRIQEIIDRRFYRQKVDAGKALAAFADIARTETSISEISGRLTATVQEALHPQQLALWINQQRKAEYE